MLLRLLLALCVVPASALAEIKVIAHRGASGHAPENTLAAFRKAVEAGADYFEIDCRLTKDGQVVICHDSDVERTGGGAKTPVASLTLEEIQRLDAGAWFSPAFKGEKMPSLAEALAVATPKCGVYVEIKSEAGDGKASAALVKRAAGETALTPELRAELLAMANAADTRSPALTRACIAGIRAKKMEKQVVIQSFSPLICIVAICDAPEIRTELLISDDEDDPGHFPRLAAFGNLIGVQGFNPSKDSLTPARLADFHAAGKTVAVYTVNEVPDMKRFAAMGVNAIITNFPAECRDALVTVTP